MFFMIKVSIIVPIYNVQKYLDKCLDSLENQTLIDIEIICVIDKSPDDSYQICCRHQKKDSRIKILNKPTNDGLGITRNVGLNVASGEFVAFCDSDDYVRYDMYEILYQFAKEKKLDACYCNYVRDTNGIISKERGADSILLNKNHQKTIDFLLDMIAPSPNFKSDVKYMVSSCMAIYSLDVIKKNNILFESERKVLSEDTLFNVDFLVNSECTAYLPYPGYFYRYNPISLSHTYNHKKKDKFIYFLELLKDKLDMYFHNENDYILHYQRFVFYIFRILIKYESILNIDNKRYASIKDICSNELLGSIYKSYPYKKLSLPKRIFFLCMKHKIVYPLVLISLLDNKINKVL